MWNPGNVVMLATKEKATSIGLYEDTKQLVFNSRNDIPRGNMQHLYITSYEEIKEGDWIRDSIGSIRQADSLDLKSNYPKIIVTTDTLNTTGFKAIHSFVASISPSFIIYFITEYNKGNVIDKVLVEYDEKYVNGINLTSGMHFIPTPNPDNTINIKAGKDEHIADIKRMILLEREYRDRTHHFVDEIDLNKWIKNNLK